MAQRRKNTEQQSPEPCDQLLSLSHEARRLAEALRSSDRPAVGIVESAEKLQGLISTIAQTGQLEKIKDTEAAALLSASDQLPDQLLQHCQSKGIQLSGAFPDFIFDGIVYLKIRAPEGVAYVNGSKHSIWPVETLTSAVDAQLQELKNPKREAKDFLARLWKAYSAVLQQRAGREQLNTKRVGVYEILPQMALLVQTSGFLKNPTREQFTSYSQHNLRADLFAIMQANATPSYGGFRLVLEPTSVAEDGLFMYLPSLQRCGYVGHISFVSTDSMGGPR